MPRSADNIIHGRVVMRLFAQGSKSEVMTPCLEDDLGNSYRLRVAGKGPGRDPELEAFVGKSVAAQGEIVHGNTLIILDIDNIRRIDLSI